MRRFTLLSLLTFFIAISASAYSITDAWISMPDSFVPSLSATFRRELVDLKQQGRRPEVANLLQGETTLDTLTADYMRVSLSPAAIFEMCRLPMQNGDTIVCVVKTYSAPAKESEVAFYNRQWLKIELKHAFAGKCFDGMVKSLVAKPDTMAQSRFEDLSAMLEPVMGWAELSANGPSIVFHRSAPLVESADKKLLEAILLQRRLKWNGETFK